MEKKNQNHYGIIFVVPKTQKRYSILDKRKITPSRYLDEHIFDTLGVRDSIEMLFKNMVLLHFFLLRYPTYDKFTLEYINTLKVEVRRVLDDVNTKIYFQLFYKSFYLGLDDFVESLRCLLKDIELHPRTTIIRTLG